MIMMLMIDHDDDIVVSPLVVSPQISTLVVSPLIPYMFRPNTIFPLVRFVYNNSLSGIMIILHLAKSPTAYIVVITSYNEVCAYNECIEPYNQLHAAYKETFKHTILT